MYNYTSDVFTFTNRRFCDLDLHWYDMVYCSSFQLLLGFALLSLDFLLEWL